MPAISIIIPVYKVERYLRRCLNSVANQTYSDWEAVCVNDGSPDGCQAILEEYARGDSRFKVYTKANGGLSDARNVGVSHCTGDYVMFLDSDDLIHPQTMEIAMSLALRDRSDVVSWYKDQLFHLQIRLMARLGYDVGIALPWSIGKRYDVEKVESYITDDIFAHATEYTHTSIKHPVKHFFVWRHLLKRELIADVPFIKGITMEDFPWWSEVMIKNPQVSITNLPFYYYSPNLNSIYRSSAPSDRVKNWIAGLSHSYALYEKKATDYQREQWQKNCMWPVVIKHIARPVERIEKNGMYDEILASLKRLWTLDVFSAPPDRRSVRAQRTIARFIGEE